MDSLIRRCLAMSVGAVALAFVLLAAGIPGATLLAFAPVVVCLGAHLVMGHGAGHGAAAPQDEHGVPAEHSHR
jgi:hypothetical protein